jgi:hypothetical protein
MRNNYKSGTKEMTDEQVLAHIQYHHKYMMNDSKSVSHLTKACYYENEAKKRGYTEEQITDYCNRANIAELTK